MRTHSDYRNRETAALAEILLGYDFVEEGFDVTTHLTRVAVDILDELLVDNKTTATAVATAVRERRRITSSAPDAVVSLAVDRMESYVKDYTIRGASAAVEGRLRGIDQRAGYDHTFVIILRRVVAVSLDQIDWRQVAEEFFGLAMRRLLADEQGKVADA